MSGMTELCRVYKLLVLAVVWTSSLPSVGANEPDLFGLTTLDNGILRIKLPHLTDSCENSDLGIRFMRAGWLCSLSLTDAEDILRSTSVWPELPAFGCPQEFTPAIELTNEPGGSERLLKVGVGIVRRPNPDFPYQTVPERLFPWDSVWTIDAGSLRMQAIQVGECDEGYAYRLVQETVMRPGTARVLLKQTLSNTGTLALKQEVLLHPFFDREPYVGCKIGNDERIYLEDLVENFVLVPVEGASKVTIFKGGVRMMICSDTMFSRVGLWQDDPSGAFSVEPFIEVNLAPGESQSWIWEIVVDSI